MSLFDNRKERVFQHLPFVFSLLGAALLWLVPLLSGEEVFSPLQSSLITVFVVLCLVTILYHTVPPAISWAKAIYRKCVIKRRQDAVLTQLKELVNDGLNELFASELQHSLICVIRDLPSIYINNERIRVKLSSIADKFNILTDWRILLVQSLKNPGIIHQEHRFPRTIHDVTRFHYSLGDVIRELNAIDFTGDSSRPRNKQTERIVVDKYNYYVSRLEETIKSANKLGTNLPSPSFTRLELK